MADALNVRTVAPIIVRFTEPINHGEFRRERRAGCVTRSANTRRAPPALSLDLANRVATLSRPNPLVPGHASRRSSSAPRFATGRASPIEGPLDDSPSRPVPPEARPPGRQARASTNRAPATSAGAARSTRRLTARCRTART
jgi:hypothetical protein